MKWYTCPEPECGQEAEFLRFRAEVYATPFGKNLEDMPRTRKGHFRPIAVQREVVVRCPVHGERLHRRIGHHISVRSAYNKSNQ